MEPGHTLIALGLIIAAIIAANTSSLQSTGTYSILDAASGADLR